MGTETPIFRLRNEHEINLTTGLSFYPLAGDAAISTP